MGSDRRGHRPAWYRKKLARLKAMGARCYYCGQDTGDLTLDHIVALAQGGRTTPSNLVAACRSCNSAKGPRSITPRSRRGPLRFVRGAIPLPLPPRHP